MGSKTSLSILFAFLLLLAALGCIGFAGYYFYIHRAEPVFNTANAIKGEIYLPEEPVKGDESFSLSKIPGWLFLHVSIIAGLQVLSVLYAAIRAQRKSLSNRDLAVIQFLIEIPMYLGLFGTLLGVCLTQFMSGTLVAPLAYLTTMSGILLHVFGKLTIWLALAADGIEEE